MGARVDVIIVLELRHRKKLIPVILMLVYKDLEILLQLLVNMFCLSVRLWMISSGR